MSTSDGFEFEVYVRTGARRPSIGGTHDDVLVVATSARPIDGRANDAIQRGIAEAFGVRPSAVTIVRGATARRKRIRVDAAAIDRATFEARLHSLVVDEPS